jgi:kynurenine formamidase
MQVKIKQISDMKKGDISNAFNIAINNHTGTHIDAPRHFSVGGWKISEFEIGDFFFENPVCIDVPKIDSELVMQRDLEVYESQIAGADILLVRTGFARYRRTDKERYCSKNPGFSSEAARYLIRNFSKLRAVGMDTMSFGANENLKDGIEVHKVLLDNPDRFLFIIEDLNLEFRLERIKRVIVAPLFVEEFDSSFCTVIAEI